MNRMSGPRWCEVTILSLALGMLPVGMIEASEDGVAFFEKSIRPVLVKHCYECHSADAAVKGNLKAGLALDTKQGLLTGGEGGPALVPGRADESLLLSALKYESYEMPPQGRLPAKIIADFEKWIEMGAPDPREATGTPAPRRAEFAISDEDRAHWAFQPVANPPPPQVKEESWIRADLDRFVLAKLEQAGGRPSIEADRYALLRRTTYALTGLPPKPEAIAAFISDESPDAFDKVVNRLLDSPEFGVHWGRHWLDGVRYADSIDKSGEYRRWVVRAFNNDLPYDQFVRMQIAGDLMPADPSVPRERVHASGASFDGITATGMMTLAVWENVGLNLAVAEIVDSQIDLVGRHLLGVTLACARCHDHKFDPVSAQDYYALGGILFSSHIATGKIIADGRLGSEFVEVELLNAEQAARNRELDEAIGRAEEQITALTAKVPQAVKYADLATQMADLEAQVAKTTNATARKKLEDQLKKAKAEHEKLAADQQENGWDLNPPELEQIADLRTEISTLSKQKFVGPKVIAVQEGGVPGSTREAIGDAPIYIRGEYQREGAIVPRRFPVILAGDRQTPISERTKQSGRLELAEWIASRDNPLTARVMVNRIWQQMIGHGLVRTPDNFGRIGEPPTHPELLDHLAHRFMASGWSIKQLVRDIALSSTFRQTSLVEPEIARADPENRLLGRMNRRRLTYEELRDTLLRLGHTVPEGAQASAAPAAADLPRRTMFESQDRRKIDVTAAIFDGPDSKSIIPVRAESTTAPQALFLMNNRLVIDAAGRLADRLTNDPSLTTDRERLERAWLLTLGRPPEDEEAQTALNFLATNSWKHFLQALLGTNEFSYLD